MAVKWLVGIKTAACATPPMTMGAVNTAKVDNAAIILYDIGLHAPLLLSDW